MKANIIGTTELPPVVRQHVIDKQKKKEENVKNNIIVRCKKILQLILDENSHLSNGSYICRWCNEHWDDHTEDCPVGLATDLLYDINHK
jgi:hypothetical protein